MAWAACAGHRGRGPRSYRRAGSGVRRVALLARHGRIRVRLQDRVNDAGEPVQLGPPDRLRPPVAGDVPGSVEKLK